MKDKQLYLTFLGGFAWVIAAIQFFAVQLFAGLWWPTGYSWSANNISDLGNVMCQNWDPDHARYVCSPLHMIVNISFIADGIFIIIGVLLFCSIWRHTLRAQTARVLLIAAALGWIVVGLFPADYNLNMHLIGAMLIFFLGNGFLLYGYGSILNQTSRRFGVATSILGVIGIVAAISFLSGYYAGIGMGAMERCVAFGLQLWILTVGLQLMFKNRKDV